VHARQSVLFGNRQLQAVSLVLVSAFHDVSARNLSDHYVDSPL